MVPILLHVLPDAHKQTILGKKGVAHSFYYEGGQTTIYRCEPDTIEAVLFVECGA
jgi:hypothetical protein